MKDNFMLDKTVPAWFLAPIAITAPNKNFLLKKN